MPYTCSTCWVMQLWKMRSPLAAEPPPERCVSDTIETHHEGRAFIPLTSTAFWDGNKRGLWFAIHSCLRLHLQWDKLGEFHTFGFQQLCVCVPALPYSRASSAVKGPLLQQVMQTLPPFLAHLEGNLGPRRCTSDPVPDRGSVSMSERFFAGSGFHLSTCQVTLHP